MDVQLLNYLQCPRCQRVFSLRIFWKQGEDIEEGILHCQCGDFYPIIRGIPRFVPEALARNRDYAERHAHMLESLAQKSPRTSLVQAPKRLSTQSPRFARLVAHAFELRHFDMNERNFVRLAGLYPEEIKGKTVLDAGCASGCFASYAARCGAVVIATDRRPWIDLARQASPPAANLFWLQAEVSRLPFRRHQFDFIYSMGGLSDARDDRAALRALVAHLAPDGRISVRLHRKMGIIRELINGVQRRLTTAMPASLLLFLCGAAVPVGFLKKYLRQHDPAKAGHTLGRFLDHCTPGISVDTDSQMRIVETFQWYGEKYQWHRTFEEIREVLQGEGFRGVKRLKPPQDEVTEFSDPFVSVIARRTAF
jgi:2-polyprenyl-3-methyl-5-hydroxy-6-metoxy-1,4-benzoquinol methylase